MSSNNVNRICRKCGQAPFIILEKVHIECRNCFVESCVRKFRQSIGKAKLVQNNDSLLVAYSGGQSSKVMLDIVKSRLDASHSLEPKFRPSILHIDMQSVLTPSRLSEIILSRLDNLRQVLNQLTLEYPGWPIYWTSIETVMVGPNDEKSYYTFETDDDLYENALLLENEDAHLKFQQAMCQSGDLTDKQKFVDEQCSNLICRIAQEINLDIEEPDDKLKFVFVGSSATQLSNNLLVDVILGKGATIRPAVSISDERSCVPILRPMRDFSKKEIAFYLIARNINHLAQPNLLTKADRKASIQTVTEAFLSRLYVDYPSTYSTLLRTGGKLV